MVDFESLELPLKTQAELLSLNRSSLYYKPVQPSQEEVLLKNEIDVIYTDDPCYGSRTITTILKREGHIISRPTVQKFMREMGISAIYPGPNLSKREHENRIYPYLLRGVTASHTNHVWGTDITYIRLRHGWLYLVAFIDWFSRYVLSWELNQTLEVEFVLEALNQALARGRPKIINSDQGGQYTSAKYIELVETNEIKISMDGRNRALDNIFTERLWRTLKYQEIYINDYSSPREARNSIDKFFEKYNNYRPHQGLNGLTPAEVYYGNYTQEMINNPEKRPPCRKAEMAA